MLSIVILSAATATLAYTLHSSVPVDAIFDRLADFLPESILEFLCKLRECPYCLSHYVAFPLAFFSNSPLPLILNWLALIAISQIFIIPISMVCNARSD